MQDSDVILFFWNNLSQPRTMHMLHKRLLRDESHIMLNSMNVTLNIFYFLFYQPISPVIYLISFLFQWLVCICICIYMSFFKWWIINKNSACVPHERIYVVPHLLLTYLHRRIDIIIRIVHIIYYHLKIISAKNYSF